MRSRLFIVAVCAVFVAAPAVSQDVRNTYIAVGTQVANGVIDLTTKVTGVLPAANGGAGTINGALKSNGSGTVSQAACADLSNAGACSATFVDSTTWTPSDGSGAGLTFTNVSARYFRIGPWICVSAHLTYPSTADGSNAKFAGLPVATASATYGQAALATYSNQAATTPVVMSDQNATTASVFNQATGSAITNVLMSGKVIYFNGCYPAS